MITLCLAAYFMNHFENQHCITINGTIVISLLINSCLIQYEIFYSFNHWQVFVSATYSMISENLKIWNGKLITAYMNRLRWWYQNGIFFSVLCSAQQILFLGQIQGRIRSKKYPSSLKVKPTYSHLALGKIKMLPLPLQLC